MRDLYMKTGQGFLLVFSITSSSSLDELANLREEIIRIKDDENVPIVIVGNKADLEDNRAVPRAKGFSISQRWDAPYYEASARTRSTPPCPLVSNLLLSLTHYFLANVDEVFIDLCRQMLRRDDDNPHSDELNDDGHKFDGPGPLQKRRRRRRLNSQRCIVL